MHMHGVWLKPPLLPPEGQFTTMGFRTSFPLMPCAARLQVKMRELGVLGNANYKLVCMLDHKAMLTVQTEKYGVFDCKPLQFIWAKVGHCC